MAPDTGTIDDFEAPPKPPGDIDQFVLALDGFEGPIDLLLTLARDQKVDLIHISILQLAEQYLAFVEQARRLRLELAADYLVMAAWLAYLKSRLLVPQRPDEDEPSGELMAEALTFQLRRLEAMQEAAARLQRRPRLGVDIFARGAPETIQVTAKPIYDVTIYDLLRAYAEHRLRDSQGTLHIDASRLYSIQDAVGRLEAMLGRMGGWTALSAFLPPDAWPGLGRRSAMASTFVAALELAKAGKATIRQDGAYGPIYIRAGGGGEP